MNRLDWVEESTQSILNVCIEFDTWKNIENFTFLEENSVKRHHINRESKSLELTI